MWPLTEHNYDIERELLACERFICSDFQTMMSRTAGRRREQRFVCLPVPVPLGDDSNFVFFGTRTYRGHLENWIHQGQNGNRMETEWKQKWTLGVCLWKSLTNFYCLRKSPLNEDKKVYKCLRHFCVEISVLPHAFCDVVCQTKTKKKTKIHCLSELANLVEWIHMGN